jgi:hypothetical protein
MGMVFVGLNNSRNNAMPWFAGVLPGFYLKKSKKWHGSPEGNKLASMS